jgi:hypothetical protein
LQAVGLHADVTGSVITLKWSGDLGAAATLSKSLSVGATETVTLSGSTFASASGPVVPTQTFNFIYNSRIMRFRRGVPMLVTFDQLQKLVAAGMPIE